MVLNERDKEITWQRAKEERSMRSMLFEIVYDRALRQALLFSAFSFFSAVRGIRLRSLHSINILPPCYFSFPFISSSYTWLNREGTADWRPIQGCCHRYVLFFFSFLYFYPQFVVLALLYFHTGLFRNVLRFILSLRFENNKKLNMIESIREY